MKLYEVDSEDKKLDDFFTNMRGFDPDRFVEVIIEFLESNKGIAMQGIIPTASQIRTLNEKLINRVDHYISKVAKPTSIYYPKSWTETGTNHPIYLEIKPSDNAILVSVRYNNEAFIYQIRFYKSGMVLYKGYSINYPIKQWALK